MMTHPLELTYEQFLKQGKSISDTRLDKYIIYERLDKGAFGTVYRGMNDITKKQVAVKVIDLASIQREQNNPKVRQIRRRLAKTESEMMGKVQSPHVMKLYDVYQNKSLKIMVIEYCNGGTLSDIIYQRGRVPEKEAVEILKQLIMGISLMHKNNIIHRDLKSENIMCHNGIYKIVDLGFAKMLPSNSEIYTGTILGTIITMAPQIVHRQKYGVKADIWSIGIIFYEMVYGTLPYEPMRAPEMYDQIIQKDIFPNNGKVNGYKPSNEVLILMKQMIQVKAQMRLSWNQLISQKVFLSTKQKLPEQYRVTVEISHLKQKQNQFQTDEERYDELNSILSIHQSQNGVKIQKLSRKQKEKKLLEIDLTQNKILQQAREYYLECLKTEFILNEIITPIQQKAIFPLKERRTIELLYLLTSRCYCNMSNVHFHIGNQKHDLVKNLMDTVDELYKTVGEKFNTYCEKLSQVENKVGSMIGDRFQKLFDSEERKTKDLFLVGVEIEKQKKAEQTHAGFTKNEQITYTYNKYITPMISQAKQMNIIHRRLKKYESIMNITEKQLRNAKFYEIVDDILKK